MVDVLKGIRAVVLDMDGVLWRGETPLPGLTALFDFFAVESIPFVLATNNSTTTQDVFVRKLSGMGVVVPRECVVTSAVATAAYLREHFPADVRVHVVGEAGLYHILLEAGITPVMMDADVVVVGMDRDVTYEKLRRATTMIRDGAVFIGTNGDRTFPMPDGLAPGAGTILAALEASTDQQPLVIGKPENAMFEMALAHLGTDASYTLMVGDRLETDIVGAQRAGLKTALVWSGVTTPELLAESGITPDLVCDDIAALGKAWRVARS